MVVPVAAVKCENSDYNKCVAYFSIAEFVESENVQVIVQALG